MVTLKVTTERLYVVLTLWLMYYVKGKSCEVGLHESVSHCDLIVVPETAPLSS